MNNIVLVVLKENTWFFAGLDALLPEMTCLRMDYRADGVPPEARDADEVIIAVDSLIFFRGEWGAFTALRADRPDASVVWLTREYTGRIFPQASRGDLILAARQDLTSLGYGLRSVRRSAASGLQRDRVKPVSLTATECRLLPYFTAGADLHVLSRRMGCAVKTLYAHRQSVMAKAGFRQQLFLQYVYVCNPGFAAIFNPERHRIRQNK
ncbi:MAG: transcriptional regulator [Klebsiella quasipneumoniae]|nr:transcriptional regulator [Klebsiella quasipneumoniae]